MNWFIFLSIILVSFFQEGYCCMKIRRSVDICDCPDIRDRDDNRNEINKTELWYTEGPGCARNLSCGIHYRTFLAFNFHESEIPIPDDAADPFALIISTLEEDYDAPPGPTVNMFSYYGIICENKDWYATIYPIGIRYYGPDYNGKFVGGGGEFNGLKSRVWLFKCKNPL
ncbi:hypothetical protein CRE_21317 [Caenorhabditis remanei]|uniref:Uncharacterized protein n=1 Tax=Caenorhabditis remanei TaxID=31234 RepID=E3MUN8_CAERE|nr:hypothetical protein CRE_21317 [Caenorhabditis remanei]